jgi:hypothetical protein
MRRKRLTIDEIDSVGAVDEPDNPPASLLFWKRKPTEKTAPEAGADPEGVTMDEATETVKVEEAEVAKIEEVVADDPVELAKRQAAEEVEKARQERDVAVEQLAEEVSKRLDGEWVQKMRPFELLLGPAEVMGPTLRKIAAACPDEYTALEAALRAAAERANLAKILVEVGENTGTTLSAVEQRDRFVADMRKAHPAMSEAQARAAFWEQHPEAKKASREGV